MLIVAGNFLFGLGYGALMFWYPAFLMRVHGQSTVSAGMFVGIGMGLGALLGYLFGGWAIGRLVLRDERRRAGYPALAMLLFAPLTVIGASTANVAVAVGAFSLAFLLQASMLSGIAALTQSALHPRMRGTGAAVFNVVSGLNAVAIAPAWSGWLNDRLQPVYGQDSVRYCLFAAAVAALVAACFYLLARSTVIPNLRRLEK